MKKTYILKGLDCPHCSAEIEKAVSDMDGIEQATVNFMKQTLSINVNDKRAENIDKKIEKLVHEHEPDVEVIEKTAKDTENENHHDHEHEHDHDHGKEDTTKTVIRIAVGALIYVAELVLNKIFDLPLYLQIGTLVVSYLILGGDVLLNAVKNMIKGRIFDENLLMSISSVGAFIIGEYPEAVAVMLFYQIGEFFQSLAVRRSRKSISDLMDIRPDTATVIRNGITQTVSPESVEIDEYIYVKPGEKIPLDGIITDGSAMLDTRALTGESLPRSAKVGDEILSGSINLNGVLTIKTTKSFGDSTVSKIIELVENASSKKASAENFITTFARYYTPTVVVLAALLAVIPPLFFNGIWTDWIHRAFVFLVISCPCALVISIPLAFFGGIGAASRHGILVKGSSYLEALNSVETVVFDKTGTLTKGEFKVSNVIPAEGKTEDNVLEYAVKVEKLSNHPIASSICEYYKNDVETSDVSEYEEVTGHGIKAKVGKKTVLAGNREMMIGENIQCVENTSVGTKVYVAADGEYIGCIVISDEIKPDSKQAIAELKKLGVKRTVMLTGDNKDAAADISKQTDIDEYHAQLMPDKKVALLEKITDETAIGKKTVFVGDGINDAPVLARADIGIAMGGIGSDAAIEAADVVIMTDEPTKIAKAVKIARYTKKIVVENIVIALGIKGIFLILGALGYAGMWIAVFGDVGVALIAVFNSMRILKK